MEKVVIESFLQLLVQSILVYVVLGPGEGEDSSTTGEDSFGRFRKYIVSVNNKGLFLGKTR